MYYICIYTHILSSTPYIYTHIDRSATAATGPTSPSSWPPA